MKYVILLSLFCSTFSISLGAAPIQEEWFVYDTSPSLISLISQHPELTLDHLSSKGLELYGPKGTGEFLKQLKVEHSSLKSQQKDIADTLAAEYPSFAELEAKLKVLVAKYPSIMQLVSVGKTVRGKDLWVVKISDHVAIDEVEPEVKYISSMHGDEVTGKELMVSLIDDLGAGYGNDSNITALIDNTEIFIMPSMNPDGTELHQRGNANREDLNRNFPDFILGQANSSVGKEVETRAIMAWQAQRKFSLSANFHGGSIVVNYPWDATYDPHPLDAVVKKISQEYAVTNPDIINSREFPQGITRGADWYVVNGGMQDWSYFWYNDLQVTIELSSLKWPSYRDIPRFYKNNRTSLLTFLKRVHQGAGIKAAGVAGTVEITDQNSGENLGKFGFENEFYKILAPGDYQFKVEGFGPIKVKVLEDTISIDGNYARLN